MTPSCSGSSAPSGATGSSEEDIVTWIVLGVVAVVAFFAIALYNRLVGLRNQPLNGWRQIDVQLKRRPDLIPNLVNTVRGAMEFERDTLTQVMEARARAVSATGPADAARKIGRAHV